MLDLSFPMILAPKKENICLLEINGKAMHLWISVPRFPQTPQRLSQSIFATHLNSVCTRLCLSMLEQKLCHKHIFTVTRTFPRRTNPLTPSWMVGSFSRNLPVSTQHTFPLPSIYNFLISCNLSAILPEPQRI